MKHRFPIWQVIWIVIIVGLSIWIDLPKTHQIKIGQLTKTIELRRGLDLAGGSHLVYELDLSKVAGKDQSGAVLGVKQTIDRRINALGVTEPTIQDGKIGNKRTVIVELPGISNTQDAINLIGKTAQLEFYETIEEGQPTNGSTIPGFKSTGLTGKDLESADADIQDSSSVGSGRNSLITGEPIVRLKFTSAGKDKFAEITRRNLGKVVAIVIDNQVVQAPQVKSIIEQGEAEISGGFKNIQEAKQTAISLNSGALPVPIKLIQEQTIGASLGRDSIEKSLVAGVVGIVLVILFMILYYGLKGVFASIALVLYTLIVVAIFKFIPVTLTLAGIAGLVLSIGAAVDANILIFERMKEEQRLGKNIHSVIDDGFRRAWSSIRDSNTSSIITATILIWLGTGIVKGFAVTLLIGILISMFSAITISQTLLKLFFRTRKSS